MSVIGLLACCALAAAVLAWPARRGLPPVRRPHLRPGNGGSRALVSDDGRRVPWRRSPRAEPADPAAVLLQVLDAVTAQVRGGATPTAAWDATVEVLGVPARALARAAHETVPEALRRHGGTGRGRAVVLSVAAAWSLADDVGAPLAEVLERLAAGLREEVEVDAEIEASLAAPRASARLLAVLPVAGLALGEAIGAEPVRVLLTTPAGRLSGGAGLALALAGHLWTRALVARAAATR